MSDTITLDLPFPERALNPNNSSQFHWGVRHRASQAAKEAGWWLAKESGHMLDPEKKYRVDMVFYPPDRRKYDLDNMSASMKHYLDGMCQAMGIDDRNIKPVPDWGRVEKGGRTAITITELEITEWESEK